MAGGPTNAVVRGVVQPTHRWGGMAGVSPRTIFRVRFQTTDRWSCVARFPTKAEMPRSSWASDRMASLVFLLADVIGCYSCPLFPRLLGFLSLILVVVQLSFEWHICDILVRTYYTAVCTTW
ncbi:unnamed protein product [Laminaria digitata]